MNDHRQVHPDHRARRDAVQTDAHLARQIAVGALVGPDAGRLAGDRGHPAQFQELGRGFPWAWDEEVVASAARLLKRRGAQLAAACRIAAGALAEEVVHWDARRAVGPERESSGERDAKVVAAQDVGLRERRELPLVELERPPRARVQQVWRPETRAQELPLARVQQQEQVSRQLGLRQAAVSGPV
jgi:hypothetical protein